MSYHGSEAMKTFTVRATAAEIERLDELAKALQDIANNRAQRSWYVREKRGRGDVVRLAVLLLEQRLAAGRLALGDTLDAPAAKAQAGLYREKVDTLLSDPLLDELGQLAGGPTTPVPIPGQTTLEA